jgi:hypothetical protein
MEVDLLRADTVTVVDVFLDSVVAFGILIAVDNDIVVFVASRRAAAIRRRRDS